MLTLKEKIWWFALYSRVFVLLTSAIFNFLISDHSADAFISPQNTKDLTYTFGDQIVKHLFGGLVCWDAQYFLHIALYGYTYENCLAFFPLFPMAVRILAGFLSYFIYIFVNQYSVYILSAVVINVLYFVKSACILHELSLQVLRNDRLAYIAAILYCINPASIFFTAPYSETLFAFLSFKGMLMCAHNYANGFSINCGIPFGLAATARSNGILGIGFIVYAKLRHIINYTVPQLVHQVRNSSLKTIYMIPMIVAVIGISFVPCVLSALLAFVPFIGFQTYGFYKFCVPHSHNLPPFLVKFAETNNLVLPGSKSSQDEFHWCNASIPISYSFVQHQYWDVGFLKYYQWKQIPNFLLAMPIICMTFSYTFKYLEHNPHICLTLGFFNSSANKKSKLNLSKGCKNNEIDVIYSSEVFVYVVHVAFLTLFCILCINIQVTTRLISSACPALYWFAASMFIPTEGVRSTNNVAKHLSKIASKNSETLNIETYENMYSRWKVFLVTQIPSCYEAKFIQFYFLSYLLIGTIMFSNFYPWT